MSTKVTWPLAGGCHCGAIRYEIAETDLDAAICHCRDCQRMSGGPFVVWLGVPPSHLRYRKGTPAVYSSSNWAERAFCPTCSTMLTYGIGSRSEEIDLATGTLDDPDSAPPRYQIFARSRQRFMHGFDETLPEKDFEAYYQKLRDD